MHFFDFIIISCLAVLASTTALPKSQEPSIWQSPYSGTITAPAAGDVIVPGTDFSFRYLVSNWCEPAFSPFTVYLTKGEAPPPFDNVTVNGTLVDDAFVLDFGKFVVSNFGLPSSGTPPPASLNLPLTTQDDGSQMYVTVLQEFNGCPGHIAVEYSLTSVPVVLGTAA